MGKRILLMYISLNSGHHRASLGLEKAIHQLSPEATLTSINALHYTHPLLERIVKKSYLSLLRVCPQVWDYLYDRPGVVRGTQPFRYFLSQFNFRKLKALLEEFKPGAVACTQAFPCGMVADYKKATGARLPLVGILTDYYAHSYWLADQVDYYVVPSDRARERLRLEGVPEKRILPYGIPIDPIFCQQTDRGQMFQKIGFDPGTPVLLLMGGSHGFGPLAQLTERIYRSSLKVQLMVVCGKNETLFRRLSRQAARLQEKVRVFGFVENVNELMEITTCLITKPGGITTAEALAKGLPMILLNPIGGQETANAEFLLKEGIAVKARHPSEVLSLVQDLLEHPVKLMEMRRSTERQRRPASALELAEKLLSIA